MKKRIFSALLAFILALTCLPGSARASEDLQYEVSAPEDRTLSTGETFFLHIRVTGAKTGISSYNAYDLSLSYDAQVLTFLQEASGCRDDGAVIEVSGSRIRVVGYGGSKPLTTPIVSLAFETKAPGTGRVILEEAYIDINSYAITRNAPPAGITDDTTLITVLPSFPVDLEEGLSAETLTASTGEDYTFRATDPQNYTYSPTVTVNGEPVELEDNGDGTYTVPGESITGPLTVKAGRKAKSYSVTLTGTGLTGEKTATYGTDYSFTLARQAGYTYTVTVAIAGKTYTGYTVKSNVYTVPGADITGNITVKVTSKKGTSGTGTGTGTAKKAVSVNFVGSGAQDASGSKSGKTNTDYTFTLKKQEGYTYDISVQCGGKDIPFTYDPEKDLYTVSGKGITGDVTVVITKSIAAQVHEYLTLDGSSIYLVVYEKEVEEGQVPRFDGQNMFWSERYGAYVWLIGSEKAGSDLYESLQTRVTLGPGQSAGTVNHTGNINLSDKTDINDLQLAHDLYNAAYTLEELSMIKFLNADVNSDKRLDTLDAAAVMAVILTES